MENNNMISYNIPFQFGDFYFDWNKTNEPIGTYKLNGFIFSSETIKSTRLVTSYDRSYPLLNIGFVTESIYGQILVMNIPSNSIMNRIAMKCEKKIKQREDRMLTRLLQEKRR